MKKTIKKCIAFLLCLHTVLFVVFQVSSVVMAASDSYGQFVTSGEVQESQETLEETLESEETEESVEETLESEESAEDASEETLESEESKESTEESAEETLESEDNTEESSEDEEATEDSLESEERGEETSEEMEDSSEINAIDEVDTELEGDTELGDDTQDGTTLEWMSYADYRAAEAARAWSNPELFVGQTAIFNAEWGEFACVPSIDVINFGDDTSTIDDTDFVDSGDVFYDNLSEFATWLTDEEVFDAEGNSIEVVITEAYFDDTLGFESLWYRVEAAEGYVLPDKLVENPYVMHLTFPDDVPSFLMLPMKGMFVRETVSLQKSREATERPKEVSVTVFPDFFDVTYSEYQGEEDSQWNGDPWTGYDLSAIIPWPEEATEGYHYVTGNQVILIPAEVSRAYETLMSVDDSSMYETILSYIPEEVKAQFTSKHKANLEEHIQYLHVIENVEKTEYVTIGGVEVPVTVHGKIPMDGTLSVEAVTSDTVMAEGFDIKDASEIVTALDIKIYDKDGVEWQPEEGDVITVSIGMAELGYEDGKIFRLHHKHGEEITVYEVFVVMDGKITVGTSGFSLYVITDYDNFDVGELNGALRVNGNTGAVALTVGETVVFYTDVVGENEGNLTSTWWVTDPEGAIFYEVYSNRTPNSFGSNGRWIRVTALKTTENPISLRFLYTDNIDIDSWVDPNQFNQNNMHEQSFSLSIVPPRPTAEDIDGYKLYIKDTVNTTGTITAVLVDAAGNEVPESVLGGKLSCSWERDDDAYIIPMAYKNDGVSIDICRDHGGLLQNRLTNVVYTVTATLPNGLKKTASYKVYYQSEILNASFENPETQNANYTFLPNGYPNLFWKTTSPGTLGNLARDIEFARYNATGNTDFGNTSFHPNRPDDERQIAEINAENFGALYQDIITAPGEELTWQFSHAERGTNRSGESMFIVLGPTEHAQTLTNYTQLQGLLQEIVTYYRNLRGYTSDEQVLNYLMGTTNEVRNSIRYEKTLSDGKKAVYEIWYNDADSLGKPANAAWTEIIGRYLVPDNQYRTRLFFVTNPLGNNSESNYGNLIDSAQGGQYKDYLIEYYEEKYVYKDGATVLERKLITTRTDNGQPTDEKATAIMYSSAKLQNFLYFETVQYDILSTVFINGKNSPYNIKYLDYPCLFIENYTRVTDSTYPKNTISCLDDRVTKPAGYYDQYDIVMQICFRDTMIAVQKWVEFPKIDGEEALTATQKQNLIDELLKNGGAGYVADFHLDCMTENNHFADSHISITKNDPQGWYTGYIPIGDNPNGAHKFKLIEESVSPLTGLEIDTVRLEYFTFLYGVRTSAKVETYTDVELEEQNVEGQTTYKLVATKNGIKQDVVIEGIDLDKGDIAKKIAEIKVTNTYREKQVKYNYVAVGHGKIAIQDADKELKDSDSEQFLYYSGDPKGVKPHPEQDYTFAGWYLDAACTIPVDANHGYVDAAGGFIPYKAKTVSDDVLEVTYYAKFSIGSIQIIREDAEPGQVFVYEVRDKLGETMYVTVVIGADGKGSTEIVNASFGNNNEGLDYTVTQLNDWSWRYKKEDDDENTDGNQSITQTHKETEGLHGAKNMTTVFRFPVVQRDEEPYWLNGNSAVKKNIYDGGVK